MRCGTVGVVVALALSALPGGISAQSAAPTPDPAVRYSLVMRAESDSVTVFPALRRWGVSIQMRYRTAMQAAAPSAWMQLGEGEPFLVLDSLHSMVSDSGPLLYAEYDRTSTATELGWGDIPAAPDQGAVPTWGVTMVRAPEVWARGIDGSGITVGIMDSGIDCDHPLLPNVAGGRDFTTTTGDLDTCAAWDDDIAVCKGHGTHVAGTVGGQEGYGVAPGVSLYALKVFDDVNGCAAWMSSQMQAMMWAADNNIRVVNASLGGGAAGSFIGVLHDAAIRGTYLVAAIGNSSSAVMYPGAYPEAIGVAAVTTSGARASYSGQGQQVDVAAPGSGIVSARPGGGTASKSGTSMASPHAAGVVALMLARRPDLSLTDVAMVLAVSSVDKGSVGRDHQYGNGLVDALAADDYLLAHPTIPRPALAIERTTSTLSRSAQQVYGSVADTITVTSTVDTWQTDVVGSPVGAHASPWIGRMRVSISPAVLPASLTQFLVTLDWP